MPEYLSPGVYVEEINTGPVPIEGVSTSTAGFVGQTARGPLEPRLVTSFVEFQRWFGSIIDPAISFLPFAVQGFFDNGGLLGKTMQVLYDNSTIVLRDPVNEVFEEIRVVLCNPPLDQLTRIWEALREPYRFSASYQVRVTSIDSQRVVTNARVVETNLGFNQNPSIVEAM